RLDYRSHRLETSGPREHAGVAPHQRYRPPVLAPGDARLGRHRSGDPGYTYQHHRGQHRRHPAPLDGAGKGRATCPHRDERDRRTGMSVAAELIATSDDTLLGGRVKLRQPVDGYRVAIDPVILAAAVPAGAQDRVIDIGCGTGAASLCLAARVPNCRGVGLERDHALAELARDNVARNGFADRLAVI